MNKRTRVGLLPTPIFAGMGLSAQAKNQLFFGIYSHCERSACPEPVEGWNLYFPCRHPRL